MENEYMKEEIHDEGLKMGRQRLDSPTSIATHIYSTNIGTNHLYFFTNFQIKIYKCLHSQ